MTAPGLLGSGDGPLRFEPLTLDDVQPLADLLLDEAVYRHIGGPPSRERFVLGMRRALAGPPPERADERWLNYAVRQAASGELLGRLEATVQGTHTAEVAFLFSPAHWGKGHARRGLLWLHETLRALPGPPSIWATTVPANTRCQALLVRCGYKAVDPAQAPQLRSYDAGDLVYRLSP